MVLIPIKNQLKLINACRRSLSNGTTRSAKSRRGQRPGFVCFMVAPPGIEPGFKV